MNLTELRDSQTTRKVFLGVPVRGFLKDISIWIIRLSEEYHSHQCVWASPSQSIVGLNRTKRPRKWEFTLSFSLDICLLLPSQINVPDSQVFGFQQNYTTGFPGTPACKQSTVGLVSLHDQMSPSLSFYLSEFILLVLFLWRTLTNTNACLLLLC